MPSAAAAPAPTPAPRFDPFPSTVDGGGRPVVRVPDLLAMGFTWDDVHAALDQVNGDTALAQELLLEGAAASNARPAPSYNVS